MGGFCIQDKIEKKIVKVQLAASPYVISFGMSEVGDFIKKDADDIKNLSIIKADSFQAYLLLIPEGVDPKTKKGKKKVQKVMIHRWKRDQIRSYVEKLLAWTKGKDMSKGKKKDGEEDGDEKGKKKDEEEDKSTKKKVKNKVTDKNDEEEITE